MDGWAGKGQDQEHQSGLTDQTLPRMDGLTLIRACRACRNTAKPPILMLTDHGLRRHEEGAGRAAGATVGWLVKPFDRPKIEVVRKVIS